ncbi:unnamed protein product [Rotaria socialis]|uniref:Tetratricopeptide repeat protein n=1 Tax=Rotaria socialis TaxID=392032 RepID=A0A820YLR8_9BILA|nr:unnamed protein product [Rotaria socialis]CAF4548411.1 unnamed protein product [Rotaria socialis]
MGMAYFQKADYPKAISFYDKALKSKIESLPNSRHISVVYCTMGQQTKTDAILKRAEERLGFLPDKHYELTAIQANVGNMSFDEGKPYEAISLYEKSIEGAKKSLSENHSDFIMYYNYIGLLYESVGGY